MPVDELVEQPAGATLSRTGPSDQGVLDHVAAAPFTLAAVTWPDPATAPASVEVRVREEDGWTGWQGLAVEDDAGAEGSDVVGTEPLLSGGADRVQLRMDDGARRGAALVLVDGGDPVASGTSPTAAGSVPPGATLGTYTGPAVVRRADWGADETITRPADLSGTVKAVLVHHTASSTSYGPDDAAAQIRSIQRYHTVSLGWDDIGYNFVVDRFGTVYEGRAGSLTTPVQGAHSGGFNVDTMGVAALGNFDVDAAPAEMVDAIGEVTGWKLGQYGRDPGATVTLTSTGGGTSRHAAGVQVDLPTVSGHRDVGYTACPGRYLHPQLDQVRSRAAAVAAITMPLLIGGPRATPVVADVDGDGVDDFGWFLAGRWSFRTADGQVRRLALGRAGDVPVVGDWDRDGRWGIGVFRDGTWHLRDTADAGPADRVVMFGRRGDVPVTGSFAGVDGFAVGVFRGGQWHLRPVGSTSTAATRSFLFGTAGDVPAVGRWLRDGVSRPGVVRGTRWLLATSTRNPVSAVWTPSLGRAGDRAVVGDWDGDGDQTPGVVRGTVLHGAADVTGPAVSTTIEHLG